METLSRLKPYASLQFTPLGSSFHLPNPTRNHRSFNVVVSRFPGNQLNRSLAFRGQNLSVSARKPRRNTIVRSEIATAGPPEDAPYSITDFRLGPRIRGICFYSLTAVAAIPLFLVMVLVHPFVLMFDRYCRRAHHLVAKIWATLTVWPLYRFEFEGLENLPAHDAPAVYVSNHQSFLDIYTLLTLGRSFKFISKTSIFVIPIIGWAMFLMGIIPLRRMDSRSQLECFKRCMDLVRKGASVFFFPEGTRSRDGKLGVFKKGAFSIAAKTEVPVVPIAILGTGKIMPPGQEGILNLGSAKVVVHKPIKGRDADMLCSEATNVIAGTLVCHGSEVPGSK